MTATPSVKHQAILPKVLPPDRRNADTLPRPPVAGCTNVGIPAAPWEIMCESWVTFGRSDLPSYISTLREIHNPNTTDGRRSVISDDSETWPLGDESDIRCLKIFVDDRCSIVSDDSETWPQEPDDHLIFKMDPPEPALPATLQAELPAVKPSDKSPWTIVRHSSIVLPPGSAFKPREFKPFGV